MTDEYLAKVGSDLVKKFRATPHNYFGAYAQSDFSSDEAKSGGNTLCITEHFGKV